MPYNQGLSRVQGDPGFFSFLGKAIGTVARFIPGPIGAVAGAVLSPSRKRPSVATPGFVGPRVGGPAPITRKQAEAQHLVLRAQEEAICPTPKRRRRIDPLNIKALRRANTRQRSFLRAVDRTLKTMPTKSGVAKRRKQLSGVTRKG